MSWKIGFSIWKTPEDPEDKGINLLYRILYELTRRIEDMPNYNDERIKSIWVAALTSHKLVMDVMLKISRQSDRHNDSNIIDLFVAIDKQFMTIEERVTGAKSSFARSKTPENRAVSGLIKNMQ